MICVVTRNFNLNRIILLSVGLWPYQRSKLVQLQMILFFGILVSCILQQLAAFVFADCTPDLVFKVLSIALFFSIYAIEYNSFRVNNQIMICSLEQLQRICNELKDKIEVDIMKKYGNNARRYTSLVTLFYISNLITLVILPFVVFIFYDGLLMNLYNPGRIIQTILPKHFVVGRENYLYLIFLHSAAATCIGGTVLVSTLMMCVTYIKHACGLFRIASYRIEKALTIKTRENNNLKNEILMYKEIIHAVDIHRKTMKFTALFFSGFQQSRLVLIIIAVLSLSLNLYGISETISFGDDTEEFIIHFIIVCAIFLYLFLQSYAGQEFMDHSDHIFSTAYNVGWYIAPLHVQKFILFLLQRGSKADSLQFGVMFAVSLELFATSGTGLLYSIHSALPAKEK